MQHASIPNAKGQYSYNIIQFTLTQSKINIQYS